VGRGKIVFWIIWVNKFGIKMLSEPGVIFGRNLLLARVKFS